MYINNNNNRMNGNVSADYINTTSSRTNTIHCVLVGNACVGKTSLIVAYTTNGFSDHYAPTAFDNYSVTVNVDDKPLKFELCDTAGRSEFDSIRPLSYADADVFLVCFSLVQPDSLKAVTERWLPEIRAASSRAPVILVGTQSDLQMSGSTSSRNRRKPNGGVTVPTDRIDSAAIDWVKKQYKVECVECSSVTHENLKEVFDLAILYGLKRRRPPSVSTKSGKAINHSKNHLRSFVFSNKPSRSSSSQESSVSSPTASSATARCSNSLKSNGSITVKKPSSLAAKTASNANGHFNNYRSISGKANNDGKMSFSARNDDWLNSGASGPPYTTSKLSNGSGKASFHRASSKKTVPPFYYSTAQSVAPLPNGGFPATNNSQASKTKFVSGQQQHNHHHQQQQYPNGCGRVTNLSAATANNNGGASAQNASITFKEGFRKFVSMTKRFL